MFHGIIKFHGQKYIDATRYRWHKFSSLIYQFSRFNELYSRFPVLVILSRLFFSFFFLRVFKELTYWSLNSAETREDRQCSCCIRAELSERLIYGFC